MIVPWQGFVLNRTTGLGFVVVLLFTGMMFGMSSLQHRFASTYDHSIVLKNRADSLDALRIELQTQRNALLKRERLQPLAESYGLTSQDSVVTPSIIIREKGGL